MEHVIKRFTEYRYQVRYQYRTWPRRSKSHFAFTSFWTNSPREVVADIERRGHRVVEVIDHGIRDTDAQNTGAAGMVLR